MFLQMMLRPQFWFQLFLAGSALGGCLWFELVYAPTPAIAQTTLNENLTLAIGGEESLGTFLRRAEVNAAVKVQQFFDRDLLRTEVGLTVMGQNGLAIAPVLKLRVTRNEWTAYPDPEIWSIYYPESATLLNLYDDYEPQTVTPPEPPAPATAAPMPVDGSIAPAPTVEGASENAPMPTTTGSETPAPAPAPTPAPAPAVEGSSNNTSTPPTTGTENPTPAAENSGSNSGENSATPTSPKGSFSVDSLLTP